MDIRVLIDYVLLKGNDPVVYLNCGYLCKGHSVYLINGYLCKARVKGGTP